MTEQAAHWEDIRELADRYVAGLGHKNDGFWDDGVYDSPVFGIWEDGAPVGFFAAEDEGNGERLLRAFYLLPEKRRFSQDWFRQALVGHGITAALPASNDELFLCLCLETMREMGGSLEMQAYNLTFGAPPRAPEFGPEHMRPVPPEEYPRLHALTENQWNQGALPEGAAFLEATWNGQTLGYAGIWPRRLDRACLDIGNFVLPEHRRKGVGRSLLLAGAALARSMGKIPTAGCWYYNRASIRTLLSAGGAPNSRLFRIRFAPSPLPADAPPS